MEKTRKDQRTAELAKIHIGAKQLGLDGDSYREMLQAVAGVRSAADLDAAGRRAVLEHLRRCGAQGPRRRRRVPEYPGRPKNMDRGGARRRIGRPGDVECQAYLRKIEAYLAEAGRPWKYADAMALRMFKIHKAQWLESEQLRRLMLALLYDAKRHGRDE